MSSPGERPDRKPLIALVDRANRALQADMVRSAHREGYDMVKPSHNAVFGFLSAPEGQQRTVDLAQRAGVTRQSMGEVVRDMVDLGILELVPDPADGRAKLVRYTEAGRAQTQLGLRHIRRFEQRLTDELGDDYEAARRVLERVVAILESDDGDPAEPSAPGRRPS
jgi:DNA-binding MarR family transcriptional regulator